MGLWRKSAVGNREQKAILEPVARRGLRGLCWRRGMVLQPCRWWERAMPLYKVVAVLHLPQHNAERLRDIPRTGASRDGGHGQQLGPFSRFSADTEILPLGARQ